MRVLLLNWRCIRNPQAGGAEIHLWKVFGRAVQQGWAVSALTSRFSGGAAEEDVEGIRVMRRGAEPLFGLQAPWAYREAARRCRPELVIEFMNKLPLFGPLYVRRPLACFVHHLFGDAAPLELGTVLGKAVQAWEYPVPRVYRRTPMLTGSASAAAELVGLGLPPANVVVTPYGTEARHYAPGERSIRPTVLYMGRLKRYKGVDHLLEAAAGLRRRFPDVEVHVAGEGDALPELQALAGRLNLGDTVRFHGRVSETERRRLYQSAWTLAFPSLKEGFGLTVAEAALCGTPTVGYDVPGLRDAIRHGETGLLVPYGDCRGLETALGSMLAEGELRTRLGTEALAHYEDFTWERSAAHFMTLLETVPEWSYEGWGAASTWA